MVSGDDAGVIGVAERTLWAASLTRVVTGALTPLRQDGRADALTEQASLNAVFPQTEWQGNAALSVGAFFQRHLLTSSLWVTWC